MNEFANRKTYITGFFILVFAIIIGRLFYIQVIDGYYKDTAEHNVMRYEILYPARGLIYDRNGALLVSNQTVYDIMVIPRELADFDAYELARVLGMTEEQVHSTLTAIKSKAKKAAAYQPALFRRQVPIEAYALLQEKLFNFPGFYTQARSMRAYPRKLAGNLIGYIGEADTATIAADQFYVQGSYMGKIGIERSYEAALRGKRGVAIFRRDAYNRMLDSYAGGAYDTVAIPGANVVCTIDAELQEYGEKLMQNKLGSIVAIEPSTGEILTLVSSPNFDPEIFIDVYRASERNALALDLNKPMFNRAVMAQYPPGSIFKCINALVALHEGTVSVNTKHSCDGAYYYANKKVSCHRHPSPVNLPQSIGVSCNAYHCYTFRGVIDNPAFGSPQAGFAEWRRHVESFGIGRKLDTDIPNELRGLLPTVATYDRMHGVNRWKSASIVSLAIGQGELGVTPLHMANLAAIIANRGFYYTPHLVKGIQGQRVDKRFTTPHTTTIGFEHFHPVVEGMYLAVHSDYGGTARVARMPDIAICGKTGTAQNPHGDDHSIFICFAPRDEPKIAMAVYVENGGAGATWAAPIASLMVEKYLKKKVSRAWLEDRVVNGNLLPQNSYGSATKR